MAQVEVLFDTCMRPGTPPRSTTGEAPSWGGTEERPWCVCPIPANACDDEGRAAQRGSWRGVDPRTTRPVGVLTLAVPADRGYRFERTIPDPIRSRSHQERSHQE